MNEYVYILDFNNDSIYKIDITNEEDDDIERILNSYGLNIDECDYMYSNKDLSIKLLTK